MRARGLPPGALYWLTLDVTPACEPPKVRGGAIVDGHNPELELLSPPRYFVQVALLAARAGVRASGAPKPGDLLPRKTAPNG